MTITELAGPPTLAQLRDHFGPILARIRAGAVERERDRRLPHDEIRALAEAGFGRLRCRWPMADSV